MQHLYNYLIKLHSAYPTLLRRKKPSRCIPPSRYADRVVAINSALKSAGESRGNENRIHVGCQGLKPRVNKKPFKWNVYRVFAFFSFTSRLSIPLRKLHPVNPPSMWFLCIPSSKDASNFPSLFLFLHPITLQNRFYYIFKIYASLVSKTLEKTLLPSYSDIDIMFQYSGDNLHYGIPILKS